MRVVIQTIQMRWDVVVNLKDGGTVAVQQSQFISIFEMGSSVDDNWLEDDAGWFLGRVTDIEADRLCREAGESTNRRAAVEDVNQTLTKGGE